MYSITLHEEAAAPVRSPQIDRDPIGAPTPLGMLGAAVTAIVASAPWLTEDDRREALSVDATRVAASAAAIAATAEMALSGGVSTADEARAYARLVARGTTMHAALAALTTGPSGRAALYAEALRDLAVLDERVGRDRRMQRETPTDVGEALVEARARVRQLQPHTVLWAAHVTVGGTPNVVCVQTRDKSDFVDDISMRTWVVGASAEISWGDPLAFSVACREVSTCHYEPMWRDRESDHVDAVDRLCDANGWLLVRAERSGQRWDP